MGFVRALIDADNVAISAAFSANDNTEAIACARANEMVERILDGAKATEYELWLSGPNNFRYKVYPEYKANRLDMVRPVHEKAVKQFLTETWQANWTDGIEADDMLGVRQHECAASQKDSIICHLDKDLNQIPGYHFNWELNRLGKVIRKQKTYFVTLEKGNRFFYYQLLVGDPTDNIKGIVGTGHKKAEAILGSVPEHQWYEAVRDLYASEEELDMNAQCVYIWRKHNDSWRNLISDRTE
jgi:DNA polymerase-1